jgi:hypothetical protein
MDIRFTSGTWHRFFSFRLHHSRILHDFIALTRGIAGRTATYRTTHENTTVSPRLTFASVERTRHFHAEIFADTLAVFESAVLPPHLAAL